MSQVITSQPVQPGAVTTTTTTVTKGEGEKQKWKKNVCSFMFTKACWYACFCPHWALGDIAERTGEKRSVWKLGPNGLLALRSLIRGKHNLTGDVYGDRCCVCPCCFPCSTAQTAHELDAQGYDQVEPMSQRRTFKD